MSASSTGVVTASNEVRANLPRYRMPGGALVRGPIAMMNTSVRATRVGLVAAAREVTRVIDGTSTAQPAPPEATHYHAIRLRPRAFVVHGHDTAVNETVRAHLDSLDFDVTVLADEPAGGAIPLIDKLESHLSPVDVAIILMTPDDKGKKAKRQNLISRARQNVVFEFGYALGVLGRKRVIVLYHPGVEIFSDVLGVSYIDVTAPDAMEHLTKELADLGLVVTE